MDVYQVVKKQRANRVDVLDAAAEEQGDGADRGCVRRDPMICQNTEGQKQAQKEINI